MRLSILPAIALLLSCTFATLLTRADPTTRPTTPSIPKDESPKQSIQRASKVFDTLDPTAALKLFRWTTPREEKFIRSYVRYAIELTRIEQAVTRKFGRPAADALVHAAGEQTESDIDADDESIEGDTATVKFKGQDAPSITLHREDGVWLVYAADIIEKQTDDELKSAMDFYDDWSARLPPIAAGIAAGKYATADEVTKLVKEMVNPDPPNPKAGF
jgi:hypothetical protein